MNALAERTRYSEEINGEPDNYDWRVRFDLQSGYLGIVQWQDDHVERVLLSPAQIKALLAFARSRGGRLTTGASMAPELDYVALLKQAKAIVRRSVLYRRFIEHTPLENDVAVWMADFVESVRQQETNRRPLNCDCDQPDWDMRTHAPDCVYRMACESEAKISSKV